MNLARSDTLRRIGRKIPAAPCAVQKEYRLSIIAIVTEKFSASEFAAAEAEPSELAVRLAKNSALVLTCDIEDATAFALDEWENILRQVRQRGVDKIICTGKEYDRRSENFSELVDRAFELGFNVELAIDGALAHNASREWGETEFRTHDIR